MNQPSELLRIYKAESRMVLFLPLVDAISAGFPSPAADYIDIAIDINRELIKNPSSTFYGKVKGYSMIDLGIEEGDIMVVDKSLEPTSGDIAVCFIDGEFTLKQILIRKKEVLLMPANADFEPIKVTEDNEFLIWGIVTYTIKKRR